MKKFKILLAFFIILSLARLVYYISNFNYACKHQSQYIENFNTVYKTKVWETSSTDGLTTLFPEKCLNK